MELRNWLLCFRCASEESRVVVSSLEDWMANSSPPWDAYCTLMECHLVALDKWTGVCPVGIGETLRRALAKLVMRAAGDQSKTACGNLKLCAGLEAGIQGATHAVGQWRLDRARKKLGEEEGADNSAKEEEEREGVAGLLNNLTTETAGTEEEAEEEEAAEGLAVALEMEVKKDRVARERTGDGGIKGHWDP